MSVFHVPTMILRAWGFCRRLALLGIDIVDMVYQITCQRSFLLDSRAGLYAGSSADRLPMYNLK